MQISAMPRHSPIMFSDRIHFDKTLSIKHFLYDKMDTTVKYCVVDVGNRLVVD